MRRSAQPRSITPIMVILGIAAIGAGLYFELPGLGVAWLCLLIAGVMHPAPPPPKKSEMDDPGVIEAQKRHRMHREAAAGAFGAAILPGWTPRYSWFFCLGLAAVALHLPISDVDTEHLSFEVDGWGQLVNAVAAFLIVSGFNHTRSKTGHDEPHPGTRIRDAIKVFKSKPHAIIAPGALGVIAGFILAPWVVDNYTGWPLAAVAPAMGVLGALAGTFPAARHEAVTHWKRVVEARNDWQDRFEQLKITPEPTLVDVELIESNGQIITIHHFKAPAGLEVEKLLSNQAEKIVGSLGGAAEAALAPVEQKDSQGQPRPGTIDRRSFDVIELPMADQMPQLTDPKLDDKVVETVIRAMLAQVSSAEKSRVLPMGHESITTDESETSAYAIEFAGMDGVSLGAVLPMFSEVFGAEVAVDHRAGRIYLGGLEKADFSPDSGVTHEHLERLAREAWWKKRWSDAFKKDNQDPRPEWVTEAQGELANGAVIHSLAFVLRNGFTPEGDFFPKEAQMRTALDGLPFFSMTGFLNPGGRPGERHPQAVVCRWSDSPVPQNPADIAPVRGSQAPSWVLASIVNEMFTANKLARPELAKATPLSRGEGKHLWHLTVRLYGGVTLAEIRKKARAMRESVAAEFFRVAESDDGVELIIGADPAGLELSSRAKRILDSLQWEQAFLDAKMEGLGGSMPKLIESTAGERNKEITTLRFDLTGTGFNLEAFTSRKNKLMATSGKSFIMPQPVKDDPTQIELIVADKDPFPRIAPIDYKALDAPDAAIPLATDVFGDYVSYNPKDSPHLMIIGTSGGGKAQPLDSKVPVPISERFPAGWANIGDLQVGDWVYTAAGRTTRIRGFSDVREEKVYHLSLDDGQVLRASDHHLWNVSTRDMRLSSSPRSMARTQAAKQRLLDEAERIEALAAGAEPGAGASIPTLSHMVGGYDDALRRPEILPDSISRVALERTQKPARVFSVDEFKEALLRRAEKSGTAQLLGRKMTPQQIRDIDLRGEWLSVRGLTEAVLNSPDTTRTQRDLVKSFVRHHHLSHRGGFAHTSKRVYPVDEALMRLARWLRDRADGHDRITSTVMTTEAMAGNFKHANGESNYAIELPEAFETATTDLPIHPYVLGYWLGDGTSRTGQITIGAEDAEASVAKLEKLWGPAVNISESNENGARVYRFGRPLPDACRNGHQEWVTVNGRTRCKGCERVRSTTGVNRPLVEHLHELGVTTAREGKHIPASYLRASKAQRLELLQGIMDSDGYISADGGCEVSLSNRRLTEGVAELLRSLSIKVTLRDVVSSSYRRDGEFFEGAPRTRLSFTTDLPVASLPRKVARLPETTRVTTRRHYVTDIRVEGAELMRCLHLEDEGHTYLTDGFVQTHNSVLLQTLIYGFLVKQAEVFIADPGKQGADFEFARDYSYTLTGDLFETAGMLRYVYEEIDRRKKLNAENGVGKFSDLPDPPKRMLVVLDEFTSLVSLEKVPAKAPTHPEAAAAHEEKVASNDARAIIGDLVGRIAREARSVGVTVMLAGQKLDSDTLSSVPGGSTLRTNMARLLVGKATYGEKAAALRDAQGAPDLGDDVPPGRGIYESVTAPGVAAQFWYDPEEQDALVRELEQRLMPVEDVDLSGHTHRPNEEPTVQKIEEDEAVPVPVDIDEIDMSEIDWDDEDD